MRPIKRWLCCLEFSTGEQACIFYHIVKARSLKAAEEEIKVYLRDFYEDELDEESGWVFTYFNGMVCVNIESIEELDIERFLNFITVNNVKDS